MFAKSTVLFVTETRSTQKPQTSANAVDLAFFTVGTNAQ